MNVQKDLLYTKDHEWVKVEGDTALVGIADYAQHSLGDIVYVDLPDADDEMDKGDALAAVESVKAAADVYIPISGKILEANEALDDEPSLLNSDPYGAWIAKVAIADKAELDELMNSEDYEKFLAEEE